MQTVSGSDKGLWINIWRPSRVRWLINGIGRAEDQSFVKKISRHFLQFPVDPPTYCILQSKGLCPIPAVLPSQAHTQKLRPIFTAFNFFLTEL